MKDGRDTLGSQELWKMKKKEKEIKEKNYV